MKQYLNEFRKQKLHRTKAKKVVNILKCTLPSIRNNGFIMFLKSWKSQKNIIFNTPAGFIMLCSFRNYKNECFMVVCITSIISFIK